MLSFDFWVMRVSFSFRGHDTDTYRTVAVGRGAFELCLPSLGFCYQNRMLWCENIHRTPKTNGSWVKVVTLAEHVDLQHYEVVTLLEVYAEQPVHCDAAGHYHNEVESYVVDGSHL